jgi:hypothetical protein
MPAIPNSSTPIQQGGAQSTLPVSESLMFAIGGGVNYCLTNSGQVGDIVMSMLGLSAFQGLRDSTWVLLDGTSCVGTEFATLTGLTNLPDWRGTYPRACDNERGLDPNGSQVPGAYIADVVGPHAHGTNAITGANIGVGSGSAQDGIQSGTFATATINNTGGTETAPKTTYANFYTKVNT